MLAAGESPPRQAVVHQGSRGSISKFPARDSQLQKQRREIRRAGRSRTESSSEQYQAPFPTLRMTGNHLRPFKHALRFPSFPLLPERTPRLGRSRFLCLVSGNSSSLAALGRTEFMQTASDLRQCLASCAFLVFFSPLCVLEIGNQKMWPSRPGTIFISLGGAGVIKGLLLPESRTRFLLLHSSQQMNHTQTLQHHQQYRPHHDTN